MKCQYITGYNANGKTAGSSNTAIVLLQKFILIDYRGNLNTNSF